MGGGNVSDEEVSSKDLTPGAGPSVPATDPDHAPPVDYLFCRAVRVNVHGFVTPDNKGAFGGVFRDDRGKWVKGFIGKKDVASKLESDLWAIIHALHEACYYCDAIVLESGSYEATSIMDGRQPGPPSMANAIEAARSKLYGSRAVRFETVGWYGNHVAQRLAEMGSQQMEPFWILNYPPGIIEELIQSDIEDNALSRRADSSSTSS